MANIIEKKILPEYFKILLEKYDLKAEDVVYLNTMLRRLILLSLLVLPLISTTTRKKTWAH